MGAKVILLQSPLEAAELIKKESFDLLIFDMIMPEMNGPTLARKIRLLPNYMNVPILCVSSMKGNFDKERAFASGMNDYIEKPINREKLGAFIDRHFNKAS